MKKLVLQRIISTTALLAAMSFTGLASAHTVPGSLGIKAGAVDVFTTTCSKNAAGATGKFLTKVKGVTKKGPLVSVKVIKGKLASNTTDKINGDAVYSPDGIIKAGGEGAYTVSVSKTGAGMMNYVLETHCQTAKATHSGQTEPKQTQNQ